MSDQTEAITESRLCNTVHLKCWAGCDHYVSFPDFATASEVAKAFREQAGVEATVDEHGRIAWKPHGYGPVDSIAVNIT